MIKPEQIPEAVIKAMMEQMTYPNGATVGYIHSMRLAAALNAWPGIINGVAFTEFQGSMPAIILPLTENGDE